MRRLEFHHSVFRCEAEKPMKLIAAAILYFAGAYAEAAEIHDGDTGYIANNSIWFTDETDLSVWKRTPRPLHRRM